MSSAATTVDALLSRIGEIATPFTIELPDGEKRTLGQGKPEFHIGLRNERALRAIRSLDEGRRYATIEDFRNFVKLAYMTPAMHHSGGTVCEPVDLPVNKRHLDMVYSHIRLSDKPFMGSVTQPERAADTVEMAKIVFGADFLEKNTVITSLINANSPMVRDGTMLGAMKVYARANQACITTPFILAGAMSPVTAAGTIAQVLAEVLAGAGTCQLYKPGAPVIFGVFATVIMSLLVDISYGYLNPRIRSAA